MSNELFGPTLPRSAGGDSAAAAGLAAHIAATALAGHTPGLGTHTHQVAGAQGGQIDHGAALTGLTDDDHTQYALLAGRAGGQTLIGGTAGGESLSLQSTTSPNLGDIDVSGRLHLADSVIRPPIGVTARAAPPAGSVSIGDLYLDDGTNTASRYPGWRRCTALSPDVWRDCPATRIERDFIGLVRHVEGAVPVETLVGGCMIDATGWIDGSGNPNGSVVIWANVSWVVAGGCTVRIRLYDYGASPGPPGAPPTLVTTIDLVVVAGSDGPRYLSQALTVNPAGPGVNVISNSARLYRAIITLVGGALNDVVSVEGGGLALR